MGRRDWLLGWLRGDSASLPASVTTSSGRADSVYNSFTGLGGPYDKGAAGRPSPYVQPLTDTELRSAFLFSGISRRIVTVLPNKATRKGGSAPDIGHAEEDRLKLWERVGEAMTMANLYGGAIALKVTDDDVPPAFRSRPDLWLQQPLDLRRVGALRAFHVFDAFESAPDEWDRDIRSPTYRTPLYWSISSGLSPQVRVHASRVVWFRGARRPTSELWAGWNRTNRMPDDSILQAVWDEVQRLCSVAQGGATLAQEIREAVVKIAGLAAKTTGDQKEAFNSRLQLMQRTKSLLGITILGEGDSYESRSNNPQGWDKLHEGTLTMLCAVLGWPRVMLTGEAPGGLSTDDESGLERERQLISDYQEQNRPQVTSMYEVIYAAQDGPTKGRIPADWSVDYAHLDEPSEAESASLRHQIAQTDQLYINAGVYTPQEVARQRFGPDGYSHDLVDVEIVEESEAEVKEEIEEEEESEIERSDAHDSVCVLIPAPAVPASILAVVEAAVGQAIEVESDPHVTVLYVGHGIRPRFALAEIVSTVAEEASDMSSSPLSDGQITVFPPSEHGSPVVIEFRTAWGLESLNERLLRRLAHRVTAKQHRRYRAHLTIGYAREPIDAEKLAKLLAIDVSSLIVPVAEVRVQSGGQIVSRAHVGAESAA